jgi:hypothetical protein
MGDMMSAKETVLILKELLSSKHGIKSALAMEINESPQTLRYRINSLCRKIEEVEKKVHEMFFLLGYNIVTQYRIIEDREREEEIRDDREYVRDFTPPDTDPRALKKFKFYVEKFLRDRCVSGYVDAKRFSESLEGRYKTLRRTGLARLVEELEKVRHEAGMDLDPFYQLVSRLIEKDNGKIYDFGWLFSASGDSTEYTDFLERVRLELGRKKEGTGIATE